MRIATTYNRQFHPFTFDFDSLYDSIDPQLALTALRDAMSCCRDTWTTDFKTWLVELIQLSIESSVVEYKGQFYKALRGLPTGGSLIVQIANISVFMS